MNLGTPLQELEFHPSAAAAAPVGLVHRVAERLQSQHVTGEPVPVASATDASNGLPCSRIVKETAEGVTTPRKISPSPLDSVPPMMSLQAAVTASTNMSLSSDGSCAKAEMARVYSRAKETAAGWISNLSSLAKFGMK